MAICLYLPSLAGQACVCALGLGVHGPIPRTGIATHRPPTARSTSHMASTRARQTPAFHISHSGEHSVLTRTWSGRLTTCVCHRWRGSIAHRSTSCWAACRCPRPPALRSTARRLATHTADAPPTQPCPESQPCPRTQRKSVVRSGRCGMLVMYVVRPVCMPPHLGQVLACHEVIAVLLIVGGSQPAAHRLVQLPICFL